MHRQLSIEGPWGWPGSPSPACARCLAIGMLPTRLVCAGLQHSAFLLQACKPGIGWDDWIPGEREAAVEKPRATLCLLPSFALRHASCVPPYSPLPTPHSALHCTRGFKLFAHSSAATKLARPLPGNLGSSRHARKPAPQLPLSHRRPPLPPPPRSRLLKRQTIRTADGMAPRDAATSGGPVMAQPPASPEGAAAAAVAAAQAPNPPPSAPTSKAALEGGTRFLPAPLQPIGMLLVSRTEGLGGGGGGCLLTELPAGRLTSNLLLLALAAGRGAGTLSAAASCWTAPPPALRRQPAAPACLPRSGAGSMLGWQGSQAVPLGESHSPFNL